MAWNRGERAKRWVRIGVWRRGREEWWWWSRNRKEEKSKVFDTFFMSSSSEHIFLFLPSVPCVEREGVTSAPNNPTERKLLSSFLLQTFWIESSCFCRETFVSETVEGRRRVIWACKLSLREWIEREGITWGEEKQGKIVSFLPSLGNVASLCLQLLLHPLFSTPSPYLYCCGQTTGRATFCWGKERGQQSVPCKGWEEENSDHVFKWRLKAGRKDASCSSNVFSSSLRMPLPFPFYLLYIFLLLPSYFHLHLIDIFSGNLSSSLTALFSIPPLQFRLHFDLHLMQ